MQGLIQEPHAPIVESARITTLYAIKILYVDLQLHINFKLLHKLYREQLIYTTCSWKPR
jgi:hypothetical protein